MKDFIRIVRILVLHIFYRYRPSFTISNNVAIIAPHPDDEVIGCAGLIQALAKRGTPPHVIILTGGEGSHRFCCDIPAEQIIKERRTLSLKVADTLGLPSSYVYFLDYPDEHILMNHSETEKLQELLSLLSPNVVFLPHCREGMPDHVNSAKIVKELMKDKKVSIYEYCVWMWYYNVWNLDYKKAYVLNMSHEMHQCKLKAIEQYITPLAPCGNPWSGVLPKPFLKAARWSRELYFKVK